MHLFETLFISVAIGCDAFAVGMGVGARFCRPRQTFRLSFHLGLFQFMMPVLGWTLSRWVPRAGRVWGPWIAFALLFLIGSKMIADSFKASHKDPGECSDPTRGLSLVVLSLAASLDALAVGFGMGLIGAAMFGPSLCFGVTAGVMTWIAMQLGNRLSMKFGGWVEAAGGLILIVLAIGAVI